MRAGEAIDAALKITGRATGRLSYMWVKERVSRSALEEAASLLEEAASIIRSALPAPALAAYSESSPGEDINGKDEDYGPTDARR